MKKWIKRGVLLLTICLILGGCYVGFKHYRYKEGIPILGYHNVVLDEEKSQHKGDIYTMSLTDFDKQMKYLNDHDFETWTLDQLTLYYQGQIERPEKVVVITFDDGFKTFNTIVKPIIEKYDLHATCFVIGTLTEDNPDFYEFLKPQDMKDDDYVSYYSHSYNMHVSTGLFEKKIETLTKEEINEDFMHNKGVVSDQYFAYPFGRDAKYSKEVLIENNVTMGFGYAQNRRATHKDDRYLMPRFLMYSFMNMEWFKWWVS